MLEQEIEVENEILEQEITIEKEDMGFLPSGTKTITENGTYDVKSYENAEVNVPQPSGSINITENGEYNVNDYTTANVNVPGIIPTGELSITTNGTYNVYDKASANVNVSSNPSEFYYETLPSGMAGIAGFIKKMGDIDFGTITSLSSVASGADIVEIGIITANSCTDFSFGFNAKRNLTKIKGINTTSSLTTVRSMFKQCTSLTTIPLFNTSGVTNFENFCEGCSNLESVPSFNTSSATKLGYMFRNCSKLKNVPIFDFSSVSSVSNLSAMFYGCNDLTDESLDNILQSCITANFTGTLFNLGMYQIQLAKIQTLPHYQDFINAGWSYS